MLTTKQAKQLLKRHEPKLVALLEVLNREAPTYWEVKVVKNMLSALKALAEGEETCLYYQEAGRRLPIEPQKVISHYCNIESHPSLADFGREVSEKDLQGLIDKIHALSSPKILLYKAKGGELAVKFPTQKMRDTLIEMIDGVIRFSRSDQFNPGKQCPLVFSDNVNTLYIPAYKAGNGELAVVFPSNKQRGAFVDILGLEQYQLKPKKPLISIYPDQNHVYINDRTIHTPMSNLSIDCPGYLYNSKEKSS